MARGLIIIPAYNEARSLDAVLDDIGAHYHQHGCDVVVVDDGSWDDTRQLLIRRGVSQVSLGHLGYTKAIEAGLVYGQSRDYDWFVCFDADGQHRACDIARVLLPVRTGQLDYVIGARTTHERGLKGWSQAWLSQRVCSLTGRVLWDTTSGFKAMNGHAARAINWDTAIDLHANTTVELIRAGIRVGAVPVTMRPRQAGRSMYAGLNGAIYMVRMRRALATLATPVPAKRHRIGSAGTR